MKRTIEMKHVGPRKHVRALIDDLIDRLEDRLHRFQQDAVSVHVLFEENGARTLYRTCLSCHIPRHMLAAHEESRNPGAAIRKAFKELERQVEKQSSRLRSKTAHRGRTLRNGNLVPIVELDGFEA